MNFFETYSDKIDMKRRLDYSFWAPSGTINEDCDFKTLTECCGENALITSAFYPSIVHFYQYLSEVDSDICMPFVRVTDARNALLNYSKTAFLSNDVVNKYSKNIKTVYPKDIVITKGGEYIGEASLVPDFYEQYAICRDILAIRTNQSEVSGEYLASYFQSQHGKSELIRTKSVQGQPHLTIEKVGELNIPIYDQDFQDEIAVHWELFYELIDDSNRHLEQAREIFSIALNGKLQEVTSNITFEKEIDAGDFSTRFDVDFYEKKWTKLVKRLSDSGMKFKNVNYIKETFKAKTPQEKFDYITLSDIDDRSGMIQNLQTLEAYMLPDRAKRKIQAGDVLVSSLKGSKEKVAIVEYQQDNLVASTGFYIIRDDDFLPEVIFLIFRSNYYDLFIEQMSSGAIMSSITEKYFKQFKLPIIDEKIQAEIAEEIILYVESRRSAFNNLYDAINKFDLLLNKQPVSN